MIKSVEIVQRFEDWGWPQFGVVAVISVSFAVCVWAFFHYATKR